MPKKIFITIILTVALATIALFAASPAVADSNACLNDYPCDMTTLDTFLLNELKCGDYFKPDDASSIEQVCEPVNFIDFAGTWWITAIAMEADYHLSATWSSGGFDTEDCSNWGQFEEINFAVTNLLFTDHATDGWEGGPYAFNLDPFCAGETGGNCDVFKVCRLTQNSNLLGYLTTPITLSAGDYILGFEDSAGDNDFEDIVIVMRSIPELSLSEPVAEGLAINHAGLSYQLLFNSRGESYDVVCNPENCVVTDVDLKDLRIKIAGEPIPQVVTHIPVENPIGSESSPGCSYIRLRSGVVKKVCPP